MSQSHEPSYYEIALTNRQVLIVFVVLLVCVVAAFFSGVWVGRGNPPAPKIAVAEPAADADAEPATEASAVDELHFFSDRENAPTDEGDLARMAEEPQTRTTLLEDLGGEESKPPPAAEPKSAASSAPPAAEPAATGTATDSPPPVEVASGYVIQVFSSSDEAQAKKLLEQLSGGGYPAFLSPVQVGSQTMMRVRIGPYGELKEAESVADRIRREFKLDTWVTR